MLRKAKITAVPLYDQPDLTLEQVDGQEHKTDAEKMTDVINEVNVSETILSNEYEAPVFLDLQTAPKAKIKRMSQKEPAFTEPEVEVTPSLDEVQADVVLPQQEPEVEPKVACPVCGKEVSAKTLKYRHGPICVIKKQTQSQENEEYVKMSHTAKQIAREVVGGRWSRRIKSNRNA